MNTRDRQRTRQRILDAVGRLPARSGHNHLLLALGMKRSLSADPNYRTGPMQFAGQCIGFPIPCNQNAMSAPRWRSMMLSESRMKPRTESDSLALGLHYG